MQPQIAQFVRVCSYDRAGLGYSDSSPRPRTSKVIAEELHTLLHIAGNSAGIAAPYILVGHSMGGYDVRLYASLYRNEVAGMVLVDASHPEQTEAFPGGVERYGRGLACESRSFWNSTTPFGIPRLLGFCAHEVDARAAECNFHSGGVRDSPN